MGNDRPDTMDYRKALMAKVRAKELTLAEAQRLLEKTKEDGVRYV